MASKIYNFRLDDELKDKLQQAADRQDRSVSNFIRHLIKEHLKEEDKRNAKTKG